MHVIDGDVGKVNRHVLTEAMWYIPEAEAIRHRLHPRLYRGIDWNPVTAPRYQSGRSRQTSSAQAKLCAPAGQFIGVAPCGDEWDNEEGKGDQALDGNPALPSARWWRDRGSGTASCSPATPPTRWYRRCSPVDALPPKLFDPICSGAHWLVFPDVDRDPPDRDEFVVDPLVPRAIGVHLRRPPVRVVLGSDVVLWTSMPETPVDEHSDLRTREHDVGCPGKTSQRNPEAQASAVELVAQRHLGLGVASWHSGELSAHQFVQRRRPRMSHPSSVPAVRPT